MQIDGVKGDGGQIVIQRGKRRADRAADRFLLKVERDVQLHMLHIRRAIGRVLHAVARQLK